MALGVLVTLTIEHGCVYLDRADGTRVSAIWPPGSTLDESKNAVVLSDDRQLPSGVVLNVTGGFVELDSARTYFVDAVSDQALRCLSAGEAVPFALGVDPTKSVAIAGS